VRTRTELLAAHMEVDLLLAECQGQARAARCLKSLKLHAQDSGVEVDAGGFVNGDDLSLHVFSWVVGLQMSASVVRASREANWL
jgi:hypothetical protein